MFWCIYNLFIIALALWVQILYKVKEQVEAWMKNRNDKQKGVDWQFTTKDARTKLKKLYPTVLT